MNPYLAARDHYIQKANSPMSWEELVGYHLATPGFHLLRHDTCFAMGRPVEKEAPACVIHDLVHEFPIKLCNAWHLWAFAGDMGIALNFLPFDLPFMGWERYLPDQNDLRFVSTASMRRRLQG